MGDPSVLPPGGKSDKFELKPLSFRAHCFWQNWSWGVILLGLLERPNECFPIYLLGNTINVCWNPLNRAHFSKIINLRGHMLSFTLENEQFPIYLIRIARNVSWKPSEQSSFYRRQRIWGVTCLGLLGKWTCFPIYLLRNPINVCWNPQKRAQFSEMINLRGHMARFTLKNEHFAMWSF